MKYLETVSFKTWHLYICIINHKKITHFVNVLCLYFIGSLQKHCLFHQSSAKVGHILEIIYKIIVYISYQSCGKKKNHQLPQVKIIKPALTVIHG